MTKQDQLEIEGLKEQIRLHKEQNRILQQSLKDAKASQDFMKQQIELGQEREKLLFMREQRDFQRIVELERKIELLVPPDPQNVNTVDGEDITPSQGEREASAKSQENDLGNTDEIEEGVDYESEEMQELVDQALKNSEQKNKEEKSTLEAAIEEEREAVESSSIEVDLSGRTEEVQESFDQTEEKEFDETGSQSIEAEGGPQDEEQQSEKLMDGQESITDGTIAVEGESKVESQNESTERSSTESDLAPNQSYLINEYFNRGLAAAEKKNYDDAIEAFTKVTDLLPDAAPSFLNLAIVHFRMGNLEEAINFNQKAIDRGSDPAKRLQTKIETEFNKQA